MAAPSWSAPPWNIFWAPPPTICSGARRAKFFRPGILCARLSGWWATNLSPSPRRNLISPGKPGSPPQRVGVSVQVITEGGTRMGALVTLRDLESLERISRQLQVSERLAALGRVTAGVAHEVKNPLNSMRLWLENLKECLPAGEKCRARPLPCSTAKSTGSTRSSNASSISCAPRSLRLEETRLDELLDETAAIARPQLSRAGVQIEKHYAELPAGARRPAAAQAGYAQSRLQCHRGHARRRPAHLALERRGDLAEIRVIDTGRGIAPEHRARIFQLFFTTRPGGSGIGLASAYKAVQLHDGSIDFDSEVGRGTTFRIELPLARPLEPVSVGSTETTGPFARKS